MSEKPYRVHKHSDNILDVIKCGNRHVLLVTGSSDAYLIAQVLNDEIAPMIAALEEKSLENMRLNERIAELEAALDEARNFVRYTFPLRDPSDIRYGNKDAEVLLTKWGMVKDEESENDHD